MRARNDDGALPGLGEHRGDVEHVLGLESEVELLGDRLGEQLDQRRRVRQRGYGIRPTRSGASQLIAARSLRTSVATVGRWTLTTTCSPVRSVAA